MLIKNKIAVYEEKGSKIEKAKRVTSDEIVKMEAMLS